MRMPWRKELMFRRNSFGGILKDEFCLGETLQSKEIAHLLVKESVKIYNQNRPHMALGYRTPESVYAAI